MRLLKNKGFTLIELLVVITLIGILAVAVLSAINPIEQINKGRDAGRRADSSQLANAIDRYFAANEIYPWNNSVFTVNPIDTIDAKFKVEAIANGVGVCGGGDDPNVAATLGDDGCATAGVLVSGFELKSQFGKRKYFRTGRVEQDKLYVIKEVSEPSIAVCFIPSSAATRTELSKLKLVDLAAVPAISICTALPGDGDWNGIANACLVCIPEE